MIDSMLNINTSIIMITVYSMLKVEYNIPAQFTIISYYHTKNV